MKKHFSSFTKPITYLVLLTMLCSFNRSFATVTATISGTSTICSGDTTTFNVTFTGPMPYSFVCVYTDGTYNYTSPTITCLNHTFRVTPTSNTNYMLVSVTDGIVSGTVSGSAVVNVNSLPAAYTGSNQTICSGGSVGLGTTAVGSDTYFWLSAPPDPSLTVPTVSNPTVSPTTTTNYYLTETTPAGCSLTNPVTITVNPLPAANAGSAQTICSGAGATIGAAAVGGDTYSWASSPADPSISSAIASNPSINPTTTTTYSLTETITATGCTSTNSVVITVNPLPSPNAGSYTSICTGSSTIIGTGSVFGDTYNWTSNPSGFTDNVYSATVSPTITTTYTLTETIVATGCTNSDSVVITVNPLPAANAGSNTAICAGGSTTIGAAGVGGDTYSWASNPSGFSSASSNPAVNPVTTTTYTLTETTPPGCTNSNSIVVTVNSLPAADAGSGQVICSANYAIIGASPVGGDTYLWSSSPTDPSLSTTSANPSVSPTTTTNYTLTETTPSGCSNSNSVVITVNPLPAANAGNNGTVYICSGSSTNTTIGAIAIGGDTYSWVSSPSGFSSTNSNPTVSPTTTTIYTLTETITSTGCTKSNSVEITVLPENIQTTFKIINNQKLTY